MKILRFDNRDTWLDARKGKITGTRVKDLIVKRGKGKKVGYYELIAEKLTIDDGIDLDPMNRGTYFEEEAIERFKEATKLEVDTSLQLWVRDDNDNIALSPDGVIGEKEAVEVKCLGSARHIEAYLTQEIPKMYMDQAIQYFVVNDNLQKLYFVFFDPRLIAKEFFWIELKRDDVQVDVEDYLAYERTTMKEVESIVAELSGF